MGFKMGGGGGLVQFDDVFDQVPRVQVFDEAF